MSKYGDIFEAARSGTADDVRYFIEEKGVDVNANRESEGTPLHIAAYYGNVEAAQYLISKKANVRAKYNKQDLNGITPLHEAAFNNGDEKMNKGKLEVAKLLVSAGANVHAKVTYWSQVSYSTKYIRPPFYAEQGNNRELEEYLKSFAGIGKLKRLPCIIGECIAVILAALLLQNFFVIVPFAVLFFVEKHGRDSTFPEFIRIASLIVSIIAFFVIVANQPFNVFGGLLMLLACLMAFKVSLNEDFSKG
jgi:ankyrin repeat protein